MNKNLNFEYLYNKDRLEEKMKHSLSIRTALLLPLLLITIVIAIIFSMMINRTYNTLVSEHGKSLMTSMEKAANDDLTDLLMDPHLANGLFAGLMEHDKYFDHENYQALESIMLDFLERTAFSLPQISAIGYGDHNKNYIGYRVNEDSTYGLMVKDEMTDYMLNIFSGESRDTEIVASYENYDPTTRPWYVPVVDNPVPQWSDVYVNYDEIQNTTITSIIPIQNEALEVMAVAGLDVNLNSINTFLKGITNKNKGVLYLVDSDFRVIAHSTDEILVNVTESDPPVTEFSYAVESENYLITHSADFLSKEHQYESVHQISTGEDVIYTMISPIDSSIGLDWYFIVVVPETDLIGAIQSEFYSVRLTIIIIGFLGIIIGGFVLNILISSILKLERNVSSVQMENLTTSLFTPSRLDFREVYNLKMAYVNMIEQLRESFDSLSESRQRYRSLIENSDALIFSMTTEGIVLTYNNQLLEYSELERDSLKGTSFYDLISNQENKVTWKNNIQDVVSSGKSHNGIYEYRDSKNERHIFKTKVIPVKSGDNVSILIATLVNIVELIEAQEAVEQLMVKEKHELELLVKERTLALEQAMEELIQKEKLASLGSLVSGISHEVNTPLGVAVSVSSYLKAKAIESKSKLLNAQMTKTQYENFINQLVESTIIIEENLMRANDLIRSFKQISVDKTYAHTTNFNVLINIKSTLKSLHHELKQNNHEVIVNCSDEQTLYGDPGNFSQIVTNFILNSIVHGFNDSRGIMTIDVETVEEELIMIYKDNGSGIDQENINKIFDPFFTTNRKKGGSGLGLNIVYNIVSVQFGGTISVESDENGTKFTCVFPRKKGIT